MSRCVTPIEPTVHNLLKFTYNYQDDSLSDLG